MTLRTLVSGIGILLMAGASFGQDPELPLDWEGEGEATFIGRDGEQQIDFDIEVHVDAEGVVSGHTSTGDGKAEIERFYYGEQVKRQYPALDSRKLTLVLSIRSSDTPLLVFMHGETLGAKHFYGELRLAQLNAEGMKEGLDLGNKAVAALPAVGLPEGLEKALKNSAPMGFFSVKGKPATKE